jgi:hypothetical protein
MTLSAMLRSKTSSRSSRWLPPMISDPRRQHVHCRDRPAVVVHPNVEGFDVLLVVHHDDRILRVLFGQIALVPRLVADPRLVSLF